MAKGKSSAKTPAGNAGQQITAEERHRRIAEAAYFRALRRGFNGGDPLGDWLSAEQEFNRTSSGQTMEQEGRAA